MPETLKRTVRGRPVSKPDGSYQRLGKTRYRRRVARMIHFLGGQCAHCGMTDLVHEELFGTNLEVDHVDPATKSFNPKARWSNRWDGLLPELEKCQALCRTCHLEKTGEGR